jgi:hypothetical protein
MNIEQKCQELALIHCLGLIHNAKPGRLRNRYDKLTAITARMLEPLNLSWSEVSRAQNRIETFEAAVGWNKRQRHMLTIVSFVALMMEQSEFKYPDKLWDAINDIVEYYENGRDAKPLCFIAGELAYQKWQDVVMVDGLAKLKPWPGGVKKLSMDEIRRSVSRVKFGRAA